MFYYYPCNKGKVCSAYPPAEPKTLKTKIGNAIWNDLTVHCFGEIEQNIPDKTGNEDNYLHVRMYCSENLPRKIKYTL